jgi:membrane protease YdiL (CAAX protease family)
MISFAVFVALIGVALVALSALGYPAWELTQSLGFDFKFSRVAARVATLVLVVGFVLVARRLRVADRVSLGYDLPARKFLAELASAFLLGVILMLPVVLTMAALGMRVLRQDYSFDTGIFGAIILTAAISGIVVGVTEETFMRGAMQTAITRESGSWQAIALTAPLYAATHFFSKFRVAPADVHYGTGLDLLQATLTSFMHPLTILDAFLCLTVVGVILGMVRALTGNIAACIGLHASWVAIIYIVRETSKPNPSSPAYWLMSDFDGFIGWMVLGWSLLIGCVIYWWYGPRRQIRVVAVT